MYFCALLHKWNIYSNAGPTVINYDCLIDLASFVRVQAQRYTVLLPLLFMFLCLQKP